jgi:predicted dipeptidase
LKLSAHSFGAAALLALLDAGCATVGSGATAGAASSSASASGPAAAALARYQAEGAARMVPLLSELLRFATVQGNAEAHAGQKAWLARTAASLGFGFLDEGLVSRVVLPGPEEGAPRLGLLVHGDVQPVEAEGWSHPPFAGELAGGVIFGRGAADDKGPLVQALLAMRALAQSGLARTHQVELIVGSDEESANLDLKTWLAAHAPPDYSLVLDSAFPVVVGEKAWQALTVTARPAPDRVAREWTVESLGAGLSPSIVPDKARVVLRWREGEPRWAPLRARLLAVALPAGTSLELDERGPLLTLAARGRSAHAGVNIEGGRNALFALARAVEGELPEGGAADLLAFARLLGADLRGAALGLPPPDALWGGYVVNVATIKPLEKDEGEGLRLLINLRRPPPWSGAALREHLERFVAAFNARAGARLEPDGFYADEPLVIDPRAKLVRRLLAAYERATGGPAKLAVSGGGTYAKRLPNAVAFGMWFPGAPYPGHDVDEQVPIEKLHLGARVLIEALVELATGPRIEAPLAP